ncbi:Uma2 family endonuclease [Candidatus Thiodictyon syntrophicum]|jgi:Uma2 family endonuclease|uniref:Uma2 family endonuclease n=1 Tax=Candidatus Thiodictyon syntrophicum TaxID=1166950 RepID=UPI0012FE48BD|nr:Uma2 family endonuclease [Candidatus Thiodictyon syntrophicum]
MSLQPKPHLSFEDWLEGERAALEGRSEYIGGEVFAMTGGSAAHNAIVMNVGGQLWTQMQGRPCQVYANDMKVRVGAANAGTYRVRVIRRVALESKASALATHFQG